MQWDGVNKKGRLPESSLPAQNTSANLVCPLRCLTAYSVVAVRKRSSPKMAKNSFQKVSLFGTLALFVLKAAGKLGGKAVFVFVGVGGHGEGGV